MRISISKSKNAESFYITKSFLNNQGKSTSKIIRKLGTLSELQEKLGTDRDGVVAWAKEQAKLETERYKKEREQSVVLVPFRADRQLDYNDQKLYVGGYLFLQFIYYKLKLDQTCKKIRKRHQLNYNLNAILSDLIYARILEPCNNRSSYVIAQNFLKSPSYEQKDVYQAFKVLAEESDFIQKEVYKNSQLMHDRNSQFLYYSWTDYSFEKGRNHGNLKKEIVGEDELDYVYQMRFFIDGDGIPITFSLSQKEEERKPFNNSLEEKIFLEYGCDRILPLEGEDIFKNCYISDVLNAEHFHFVTNDKCIDMKSSCLEDCFRTIKTDYISGQDQSGRENCMKVHFLICFLSLLIFRLLERQMEMKYTSNEILDALRKINFASIEEQGYMPLYMREKVIDALHNTCGFQTDYQFITKGKMREIQKKSKGKK